MKESIYIDSYEIYDKWHIVPLYEGFYDTLMGYPDIKSRTKSDYSDENGIDVLLNAGKLDKNEISLKFGTDTYDNYTAFMEYIIGVYNFNIKCPTVGYSINVDYISTNSFEYFKEGITFEIKVRESNFRNRTSL